MQPAESKKLFPNLALNISKQACPLNSYSWHEQSKSISRRKGKAKAPPPHLVNTP